MNFKKKISYIIVFLFIDVLLIGSLYFIIDATNINNLTKEVDKLSEMSLSIDRFNRKNKTIFKYRVVEDTIKDYLDSFSIRMNDLNNIVNEDKFIKVLSYDNYLEDGPMFIDSINYVNDRKRVFNEYIDLMILDLDKDHIKSLIRDKTNDSYYIGLYEELILSDEFIKKYEDNKILLEDIRVKYNNVFDTTLEVLDFLVLYKDSWKLEDGEIKFSNDNLLNYYNFLIFKINAK